MANRIFISGNALVVQDTDDDSILYDKLKDQLYYDYDKLEKEDKISIEFRGLKNEVTTKSFTCDLSEAVNMFDIPFTQETFRVFANENLGYLECEPRSNFYGMEYQAFINDNVVTSTDQTTPEVVIQANTTDLPLGNYEITPNYTMNADNTGDDIIVNLTFGGNPVVSAPGNNEISRIEMKDAAGNNPTGTQSQQKFPSGRSYYLNQVSGVNEILMTIVTEDTGELASVWGTYIKLIRVS